ncbi:DMT family transporter [Mycobacterium sp.]|uniref:DMT family transporter n=1 Tax=Mycobacterium sp. TaxID=1785 RepID=UPI003D6BF66D
MAHADIASLLALGAALFIAIGDVLQQRSAHEVTDEPVGNIGLFAKLLRDRRWWLGSLVAAGGMGLQAAALGFGSVLLVQALLVSSLLFALLISARLSHRAPTRWEGVWAVLLGAAVAVIVIVGNPQAGQSRASLQTWIGVAVVLGPALVACVIGARLVEGRAAPVLLALVSGSLWGLFAVLTKGVVAQLSHGFWELLRTPELYAWAVVAVAGTSWEQSSFRAGALTASLPTLTVTEPLVAAVLGVVVLGETVHTGKIGLVVLGAGVVVMVVATAALARCEAATAQPSKDRVAPATQQPA